MVNKNSFFKLIPLVLGVLVISFVLSFWAVAWTEPQENPPDGNASSPLNVGSSGQTKTGWLATLDSLWVGLEGSGGWPGMLRVLNGALINTNGAPVGLIVAQGNVGIGTTTIPSQRLDVNGQVRATDVCTTAGTCLSTAGGGFSKWTDSGSNIYNNN
ncbi:MAG: hypothetical protein NTU58_01010, partial [Candidatus Nealsonbacteria bacterium]|nr:hypothetical protein [Candidatus Nealsonbacteria bacterium]